MKKINLIKDDFTHYRLKKLYIYQDSVNYTSILKTTPKSIYEKFNDFEQVLDKLKSTDFKKEYTIKNILCFRFWLLYQELLASSDCIEIFEEDVTGKPAIISSSDNSNNNTNQRPMISLEDFFKEQISNNFKKIVAILNEKGLYIGKSKVNTLQKLPSQKKRSNASHQDSFSINQILNSDLPEQPPHKKRQQESSDTLLLKYQQTALENTNKKLWDENKKLSAEKETLESSIKEKKRAMNDYAKRLSEAESLIQMQHAELDQKEELITRLNNQIEGCQSIINALEKTNQEQDEVLKECSKHQDDWLHDKPRLQAENQKLSNELQIKKQELALAHQCIKQLSMTLPTSGRANTRMFYSGISIVPPIGSPTQSSLAQNSANFWNERHATGNDPTAEPKRITRNNRGKQVEAYQLGLKHG